MEIRIWRHFDFLMLFFTFLLIGYGLLMVYSATLNTESGGFFQSLVFRQGLFAIVGLAFLIVMISFDYEILGSLAVPIYGAGLAMMVGVLLIGRVTHGSQRWYDLGFFTLEPSEPAKLIAAIALAKFLSDHEEDLHKFRYVVLSGMLVLPFFLLTALQPNVGTSIVFLVIWLSMLLMAGLRFLHAVFLGGFALVSLPVGWAVINSYEALAHVRERIDVFLNPHADPLDTGYNVIQALYAVGSGGLMGRGFTSGTQSQLHFLRVQYADFIFSVLAEELGFIGAMLLFGLFVGLLLRGMRSASVARDSFGRLLATGITAALAFQAFVNVAINIGLLPVTGLPLPFISYGGSSLISALAAVGLLESIAMRHEKPWSGTTDAYDTDE